MTFIRASTSFLGNPVGPRHVTYALWLTAGPVLLAFSWIQDRALTGFFLLWMPLWILIGYLGGRWFRARGASRLIIATPLFMLFSCFPAAYLHGGWWRGRKERALIEFMRAEAEGRKHPAPVSGEFRSGLAPAEHSALAAEYAAGRCRTKHDSGFLVAYCPNGRELLINMHEGPIDHWRVLVRLFEIDSLSVS